jgi:hypothetical protein
MKYTVSLIGIVLLFSCNSQVEEKKQDEANVQEAVVSVQTGDGVKKSASAMLASYLQLKDALVNYDTVNANKAATTLAVVSDSIDFNGTPDSAMIKTVASYTGTVKSEALALVEEKDITEKRRAFSMITENLYPMLRAIQFNDGKIFYQMCPMAFNDSETAYWISDSREINNPYLGTKHPKYASGMLHCGELKDSISYAK